MIPPRRLRWLWPAVALVWCAAAGLGPVNGAADVPVAPTAALHRPDDQRLSDSIRTALQSNHRVAGLAIHVAAQGGVVVLSGVVRSDAEKELAGRIAQRNASGIEVRNALAVARHRPRGLRVAGIDVAVA